MSIKGFKTQTIPIRVANQRIDLKENYACALSLYSRAEWTCDHPFTVCFAWDAPFKLAATGKNSLTLGYKAGARLQPLFSYPYTIAVFSKGQVINGVGIIIVRPPRPDPPPLERFDWGALPSIIIVKPPKE